MPNVLLSNLVFTDATGTAVYPHMPILRLHEQRISSAEFGPRTHWTINRTSLYTYSSNTVNTLCLRSGRFVRFWASGEQSSPKWEIPCPGRQWTTVQNLMRLALSLAEKSVTVQTNTHKNKQTVNDVSTPCLLACVDKKIAGIVNVRLEKSRQRAGTGERISRRSSESRRVCDAYVAAE